MILKEEEEEEKKNTKTKTQKNKKREYFLTQLSSKNMNFIREAGNVKLKLFPDLRAYYLLVTFDICRSLRQNTVTPILQLSTFAL